MSFKLIADALLVALTRCSGIILGVFVSVILASFIFPKSASHQAADNLALALDGLCHLCQIAWNATQWNDFEADSLSSQDCYVPLGNAAMVGDRGPVVAAAKEAECEKVDCNAFRMMLDHVRSQQKEILVCRKSSVIQSERSVILEEA